MTTALAAPRRRAVLLLNVGTPDAPDTASVRRYLREFLSDARVLDMSPLGRWALLNFVILPFRPAHSARAYQAIWEAGGSPLLRYSVAQKDGLAARLPGVRVLLAMRYGRPTIEQAVRTLRDEGIDEVLLVPLYPQYASASTGSSLEAAWKELGRLPFVPTVKSVPAFFDAPEFLNAWAQLLRPLLAASGGAHLVLSYHGLPEHQTRACDPTGAHCLKSAGCCDALVAANHACYRAQCFATTRGLAERLGLGEVTTCFQSRLGRVPWILPHTDLVVPELAKKGVRKVLVACPSFVSDCLETLEEVGIRLRQSFLSAGGESFALAPCLNDHPAWLDALETICSRSA